MSSSDEQAATTILSAEHPEHPPTHDEPRSPPELDENNPDAALLSAASSDGRVNGMEKVLEGEDDEMGVAGPAEDVHGGMDPDHIEVVEIAEHSGDDSGQWSEDDSHELKRVKVYQLIANRWVDQGTAFCFGDLQDGEALLVARAEMDFNHIILSTVIRGSDVYQRQQDTLIVWTEPDGNDYALSFQDPDGCAEVWQFIQEVQRHMTNGGILSSPVMGSDQSVTTASIIRSGRLPPPQLGIMGEIEKAIKMLGRSAATKEQICEYFQHEDYIKSLIDVYHQAEDLESLENLHAICSCMQAILMLNDHSLYEHILEDELFFGVVGILEYDPEFPTYKANYRDFLHQTSQFHQPIPLGDEQVQKKVHHTYRLLFLKDVVLARAIDDSTFNVLNSCIIFNQIDIINHVQNHPTFLRDVVAIFMDDDLLAALGLPPRPRDPQKEKPAEKVADKMDVDQPDAKLNGAVEANESAGSTSNMGAPTGEEQRRREVILLIQQLCAMGKNVQLPARMALFRTLVDRGILFSVQWALAQPEGEEQGKQMIAAAGEVLSALLDHDLNGVRGHVLKQINAMEREKTNGKKIVEKETVLALMCRILVKSRDLAVQGQIGEALRTLLEIQQDGPDQHPPMNAKMFQRAKDDPGVEKFMDYFYKTCVETLFRPFGDVPEFKNLTDPVFILSRERTNLFLCLCDLLSMFTLQHSFRSHFFILSSNITPRIASLLKTRDKHLRLAAFRFFRACLRLNNQNLFKHLIKHDVLKPILDLTKEESRRDNLLSASCHEFFENSRKDNIKMLIEHLMTRHESEVRELADMPLGSVFTALIRRHEMNIEPPPAEEKMEKPETDAPRRWGQGKLLEAEEEDWFNADDEEAEIGPLYKMPPKEEDEAIEIGLVSTPPKANTLKRKRARGLQPQRSIRQPFNGLSRAQTPLGSLVDYDENDDDTGGVAPLHASPPETSPSIPRTAALSSNYFPLSTSKGSPPSLSPRPTSPATAKSSGAPSSPGDEQDDLLESLYQKPNQSSPGVHIPPELGIKRRREDEDDELLERLASRGKRTSVGPGSEESANSPSGKIGSAKSAEEVPKKIKLKIGSVGAAVASSPPAAPPSPSSTGTKDGDNG